MADPQKHNTPAYEMLQQRIIDDIRCGRITDGEKLDPPDVLAKKWDVSVSTVRNALQILSARGVVIRRQRVGTFINAEAARGYELQKSSSDKSEQLAESAKSKRVVFAVPDIASGGYSLLARAVQDLTHERGMDLILGSLKNEQYEEFMLRQAESGVYGIFMVPPLCNMLPMKVSARLEERGIPVVTCYRRSTNRAWPLVIINNTAGMYDATRHLLNVGCKRIGFVDVEGFPNDGEYYHYFSARYGYLQAMMEAGIKIEPQWILNIDTRPVARVYGNSDIHNILKIWIESNSDLDGIICYHGDMGVQLYQILLQLGRRMPEDVALISNGGGPRFHPLAETDISHMSGSFSLIASEAFAFMDRMHMDGFSDSFGRVVAIEPPLIRRRTTVGENLDEEFPNYKEYADVTPSVEECGVA